MHIVAIGGSDAGISAALRIRELDSSADVTVVMADAFPNFSICGIPYYISGEVPDWRDLAHRTKSDLEAAGMSLRLDTVARRIDVEDRRLLVTDREGNELLIPYDGLIVATGALPVRPPIDGLYGPDPLGVDDGVHLLHSMGDTFDLMRSIERRSPERVLIVGGGYIGLEMAEALVARGLEVTQMEQLDEVLPTVDPQIGALVHEQLTSNGVNVVTATKVDSISRTGGRLSIRATSKKSSHENSYDMVLVVVGVRPDTGLASSAGARLGERGAIAVDREMRTDLPQVFAAGDCVVTHHRLIGDCYLPLGTTAHKQGRVAGENALGGSREFAGSLGTQVVKVFDSAVARTGLRDHEASSHGFDPLSIDSEADDHKAYYPGSYRISMRVTGDRGSGRLLGMQMFGHKLSAVAKRIDIAAAAIFNEMSVEEISDLDLSYTPPLGSPWDAVQIGTHAWTRKLLAESY